MSEPRWLTVTAIRTVHRQQITRHGGAAGLRDLGRLEAAIDRARNRFGYEKPDLFELAASYAHGIASGHPFIDGNKRASLLACMIFLDLNGIQIDAEDDETYRVWMDLASGVMREADLADWLRLHAYTEQSGPPS